MVSEKVKITQKEIDEIYQIEEITEEIPNSKVSSATSQSEDTTPEFLTEEEESQEKEFYKDMEIPDIEDVLD